MTSSPGGISATGPSSPINVTGLTNTTAYTFRVVATNAIGNSEASTASTVVTPVIPITAPDAPTNVVATVLSANSVSVAFTAPASNGGSVITNYMVNYSFPGGVGGTPPQPPASPIVVFGLTTITTYTFTVIAMNAVGSSSPSLPSNIVTTP